MTGAVAFALALSTACSTEDTPAPTPTGVEPAYNAALTGIVNPSDKTGGTLNLYYSQDLDSWDPQRTYYASGWNMHRLYTRTLVAFDAKPGKDGLKLVNDLAQSQEISSDGKTYTYKLKDGVKWRTDRLSPPRTSSTASSDCSRRTSFRVARPTSSTSLTRVRSTRARTPTPTRTS